MQKQTSDGNFLLFIAYLQIIGIILVVFGHSFHEYPDSSNGGDILVYRLLHSFRMPLFMFTSGFLMTYTCTRSHKSLLRFTTSKIKRLLLPFAVLTCVTFIPRAMLSSMADDGMELSWHQFMMSFIDMNSLPIPFFWFIHASFTLLIVTYGAITLCRAFGVTPLAAYIVVATTCVAIDHMPIAVTNILSLNMTVRLVIFFIAGCLYHDFMNRIDSIIQWTKISVFAICSALWMIMFHFLDLYGQTFYYPCAIAGISMSISLAKILESRHITVLDHLIGSNYIIFLLSWYFNVLTQQVLSHFVDLPWQIHTMLSLTCGIYIPWLIYRYLNNTCLRKTSKAIALLLGQSLKPVNKQSKGDSVSPADVDNRLYKIQ